MNDLRLYGLSVWRNRAALAGFIGLAVWLILIFNWRRFPHGKELAEIGYFLLFMPSIWLLGLTGCGFATYATAKRAISKSISYGAASALGEALCFAANRRTWYCNRIGYRLAAEFLEKQK